MLLVKSVTKSESRSPISRRAFIIVIVILALIIVGLGTCCILLNTRLKDREAQISSLKALVSSLDAQVSQLSYWLELNSSEIRSLRSQVEKLKATLEEKEQELVHLRSIVHVSCSEELESGKVVLIPANSYVCLSYVTPYGGYLYIQFSSTGDIYMEIDIGYAHITDILMEILKIRYPSEGARNTGRLVVAALPSVVRGGSINICIYNPSDLGVQLTIDITYWY